MNNFFNSRFWRAMGFIGTAFIVNTMWLIGCLPLITAGASTAAMCQTYFRLFSKKAEPLPRLFINGFKACFRQATFIWLVHMFFLADIAIVLWCRTQELALPWLLTNKLSLSVGAIAVFAVVSTSVYIYGIVAYYDCSTQQCAINALGLASRFFGKTILMLLSGLATAAIIYIAPFMALIGGSLCCALHCKLMLRMFEEEERFRPSAARPGLMDDTGDDVY